MKTLMIILFTLTSGSLLAQSEESGKELFNANCKACHSIGEGKLVGPDLEDVTKRRSEEWIKMFIVNSADLIESGDEEAVKIFEEYNKIAMPPHPFTEDELNDLLSYMESYESKEEVANKTASTEVSQMAKKKIQTQKTEVPLWVKAFIGSTLLFSASLLIMIAFLFKLLRSL